MNVNEFRVISIERTSMKGSNQIIFDCKLSELEFVTHGDIEMSSFNMSDGEQYAVIEDSAIGRMILSCAQNEQKFTLDKSDFIHEPDGTRYHKDIELPTARTDEHGWKSRYNHPKFIHKQYKKGTFNTDELGLLSVLLDRGKLNLPENLDLMVGKTHDDMSVDLYFHLPYYKYVSDTVLEYWTGGAYANSNAEQSWINFSKKVVYLNYDENVDTSKLRPHFFTKEIE